MRLIVYLAGEIHSTWRDELKTKVTAAQLPIDFVGPMEDHDRSDTIGESILGKQPNAILKDAAASSFNNLRTEVLMNKADLIIALFGHQYKQWNTAMDASAGLSMGKPVILIRPKELHHSIRHSTSFVIPFFKEILRMIYRSSDVKNKFLC